MPETGFEPALPQREWDFHTTMIFITIVVCGLDYTFAMFFTKFRRSVSSLYTFHYLAWLGITILKASPTLRNSTQIISYLALFLDLLYVSVNE